MSNALNRFSMVGKLSSAAKRPLPEAKSACAVDSSVVGKLTVRVGPFSRLLWWLGAFGHAPLRRCLLRPVFHYRFALRHPHLRWQPLALCVRSSRAPGPSVRIRGRIRESLLSGPCPVHPSIPVWPVPNRISNHFVAHRAKAGGIFGQGAFLQWICFHGLIITVRAELFVSYATFSSGASRDPRACRGIERKCYPAFETLDLGWPPWSSTAVGGVFFGKPEFEVFPRVWCWVLS